MEVSYSNLIKYSRLADCNSQQFPFKKKKRHNFVFTLVEKMVACSVLERNAEQKDTIELRTVGRSLSSCKLPEETSDPSKLMSNNYLFEIQLQKNDKDSQELDGGCNSQSLVMPVITTSSAVKCYAQQLKIYKLQLNLLSQVIMRNIPCC